MLKTFRRVIWTELGTRSRVDAIINDTGAELSVTSALTSQTDVICPSSLAEIGESA